MDICKNDGMRDERGWTEAESEAAFAQLGDRIIDATRSWARSTRRQRLQRALYTVGGTELSLSQVDAIELVAKRDVRMHELAGIMGVDPSSATRSVAPLVDLGLVERTVDPTNRRFVVLSITDTGRKVADQLKEERHRLMRTVLEPMAPERRLLFAELLEEWLRLLDNADESEIG
jgi:DNA-binding MarR family transcriptional regulator